MSEREHSSRPNIVYLHSHDTGRYVQPYGYPVETPSIQQLAEDGVIFRQSFSAAPTCSPSRAALLTGETPHSSGMMGLAHRGFHLNDPTRHLAHLLRDLGYRTVLTGMQHLSTGDQSSLGYADDLRPDTSLVAEVAPIAVDFIDRHANDDQPFFLDVGFEETHRPFHELDETDARYVRPPAPIPDTPETRRDMADYLASARILDQGVGMVLDAIDRAGLRESTLIICTTDHGLAFPDMKCSLTDHGIGVMLIMRGLGGLFSDGKVIDSLVSHLDVYPTVCDLLDISRPDWLQGESLLPLIEGDREEIHDALFGEVTFHATYEPQRSIRASKWHYIRRFADQEHPVLANIDDSPSRDVLLAHGWDQRRIDAEQLYDVVLDPMQRRNLIDDPNLAPVLEDMRNKLTQWMRDTNDPLLQGDVPLPPGAEMNWPDARSANEELISGTDTR